MIAAPFEKTYLSRAQSRIWSMDNPVGDPFGGPAYGEKREPVSLIAAVVAIGVGAEAVAVGATALTMVMGGLMIAGGAAAAIGAVSGNKQLAMIGGAVAGVGGLGLGAANLFADAATTTSLGSQAGDSLGQGMANANAAAGGAAPYGTDIAANYANPANLVPTAGGVDASQLVNMPSVGNLTSQTAMPAFGDAASAAGGAAPYGTNVAANYSNPGLINAAAGDSLGSAADLGGSVAQSAANLSPVDAMTNQLTTEFSNVAGNSLQPSPYEAMASNGDTPLVPKAAQDFMSGNFGNTGGAQVGEMGGLGNEYTSQVPVGEEFIGNTASGTKATPQQVIDATRSMGTTGGSSVPTPPPQEPTSWLDKIEGIAKGIEKYKQTTKLGGDLISGAMRYAIPSQSDQASINLYNAKANLANQEASAIAALEERKRRQNEAVKNLKPIQLNNASNPIFGNALNGAGIINSARA